MSTIDTIDDLINWKPPYIESIIEEGILKAGTGMIIFGEAKAWKSMLSLHTAFCIANGSDWFGYKTKQAVVFKYQSELPKYIDRERVIKYMNSHRPDNILFKTNPYISIDSSYGKKSIEDDIKVIHTRFPNQHIVLILDPVYLMIAGHVSDEYDVKRFLQNINEIKSTHNLSVIMIHHSHKTKIDSSGNLIDLGAEEIMGSSYFNNWADTMVRVKLLNPTVGSDLVEVSFGLARHAQKLLPPFQISWSRDTLHPTITKKSNIDNIEDITTKGLD